MLIFIDLETTGVGEEDTICSIALLWGEDVVYELIGGGKKIPAEASAIHHITNEMISDALTFRESKSFQVLQKYNTKEHTLVAHNVTFDTQKLAQHGLIWQGDVIDTLRVCKHKLPESESFSLQFLRYDLKLYRKEEVLRREYGIKDALCSHHALGDLLVTKLLFTMLEELADEQEMKSLSVMPVLLQKLSFGKYKGRYIEEICYEDSGYLQWLSHANDIDEDLRYTIQYFLEGNL